MVIIKVIAEDVHNIVEENLMEYFRSFDLDPFIESIEYAANVIRIGLHGPNDFLYVVYTVPKWCPYGTIRLEYTFYEDLLLANHLIDVYESVGMRYQPYPDVDPDEGSVGPVAGADDPNDGSDDSDNSSEDSDDSSEDSDDSSEDSEDSSEDSDDGSEDGCEDSDDLSHNASNDFYLHL